MDSFVKTGCYPSKDQYNALLAANADLVAAGFTVKSCMKFRDNLWARGMKTNVEAIKAEAAATNRSFQEVLSSRGNDLLVNAVRLAIKTKEIKARETGQEVIGRQTMEVRTNARNYEMQTRRQVLSEFVEMQRKKQEAQEEMRKTVLEHMARADARTESLMTVLQQQALMFNELLQSLTNKGSSADSFASV